MTKAVVLQSLALFTCGILVGSFLFSRWKHGGLPTAAAMERNATKDPVPEIQMPSGRNSWTGPVVRPSIFIVLRKTCRRSRLQSRRERFQSNKPALILA
jgi:hypothetical protein